MKASEFAERLILVTRHGRKWYAECPSCHEPTLNFSDGKNGLLVSCIHAGSDAGTSGLVIMGCSDEQIAAAMGLTLLDFMNPELRARMTLADVYEARRRSGTYARPSRQIRRVDPPHRS